MPSRTTAAKAGLKAVRATPAKAKVAKGGLKLGKRKIERTPAGTAALYGQALVGNDEARSELRKAYASARKAYRRSSDRGGRPNVIVLLQDRKASREAGNAVESLQQALRTAGRKRKKPRSAKAPAALLVLTAAGAGALIYKQRSSDEGDTASEQPVGASA